MKVIIPFKGLNPKSRLSRILSRSEREGLAKRMLLDVVDSLKPFNYLIKIISPVKIEVKGVDVTLDDRGLDEIVSDEIQSPPCAVIMSDLPLLNKDVLTRFFETEGDVVIAPGRKGGTNMLLVRKKGFKTSYHYGSFLKHVKIAEELGLKYAIFDSFYSFVDVDDEFDLLELLIHGSGKRSKKFLEKIGFYVKFDKEPRLKRKF